MRIGLLGAANGDARCLRDAVEFLLGDAEVDQAIYLGTDGPELDGMLRAWAAEIYGSDPTEEAFLQDACILARAGDPEAIESFLARDAFVRGLSRIRVLPPPPAKVIEMVGDRFMIVVHDKAVLDEEDIANAQLIVYGRSEKAGIRRFGHRCFITPGPLTDERVAVIEVEAPGRTSVALFETSGLPVWREALVVKTSKVSVAR